MLSGQNKMARRRNRSNQQRRRPQRGASAFRPRGDQLLTAQGELRTFHVSSGAISSSTAVPMGPSSFPRLKLELSGVAEYKVVSATYTWEPMVTPASDSGMVGLVAAHTTMLLTNLPTDLDSLFSAGLTLRPASSRRSVQAAPPSSSTVFEPVAGDMGGGVYVYCTKSGVELGRVAAVVTVRVRGISGP